MPLLQRVAALIRANLNDLLDKAEDPESLLKQLLLDLQNQHMQVKTQVAIAIANQHLLENSRAENARHHAESLRQAELALGKDNEALARAALQRSLTYESAVQNYTAQLDDQAGEVRLLRDALARLETKLAETRARADIIISQHRRARSSANTAVSRVPPNGETELLGRAQQKANAAAAGHLGNLLAGLPSVDEQLAALERDDRVERLLADLKSRAIGDGHSS